MQGTVTHVSVPMLRLWLTAASCLQAIRGSQCEATDINAAQAVLVYDYCLYIRWLGTVHNAPDPTKLTETPGDLLMEVGVCCCA